MTPRRNTTIALDFDCTFTSDIEFWRLFVQLAGRRGHTVCLVTARHDTPENRALVADVIGAPTLQLLAALVFTSHRPKRAAAEARGLLVDIWIDDLPELVGRADLEWLDAFRARQSVTETLPVVEFGAVDPAAVWRPEPL